MSVPFDALALLRDAGEGEAATLDAVEKSCSSKLIGWSRAANSSGRLWSS